MSTIEVTPKNAELQARFEAELGMSLRQIGLEIGLPDWYFADEHNINELCDPAAITCTCGRLKKYFYQVGVANLAREGDAYPEDLPLVLRGDIEPLEVPYWAAIVMLLFYSSLTKDGLEWCDAWLPDYLERSKAKWGFDCIPARPQEAA